MNSPPHLLLAFDDSEAAAHAIALAGALLPGAEAVIVHVRPTWLELEQSALARLALPDSVIVPAVREHEREADAAARAVAERGRSVARDAGLVAEATTEPADVAWRGLLAAAERHDATAIVCGTSGRGTIGRTLLGSTATALLHHATPPVLVVPPDAARHDGPVLIGYDGSPAARAAIACAAELLPGRSAVVAHVWSSPVQRSPVVRRVVDAPLDEIQELADALQAMLVADAEELAAEGAALATKHGLEAEPIAIETGAGAWRALDTEAEERGAALVAVGSRGRGELRSAVLGSVSAGLAHHARVPVLVVKERRTLA